MKLSDVTRIPPEEWSQHLGCATVIYKRGHLRLAGLLVAVDCYPVSQEVSLTLKGKWENRFRVPGGFYQPDGSFVPHTHVSVLCRKTPSKHGRRVDPDKRVDDRPVVYERRYDAVSHVDRSRPAAQDNAAVAEFVRLHVLPPETQVRVFGYCDPCLREVPSHLSIARHRDRGGYPVCTHHLYWPVPRKV